MGPDYAWQVDTWNNAERRWVADGAMAHGLVPQRDGEPDELAARILANWQDSAGYSTLPGYRVTLWVADRGARVGDPVAEATSAARTADEPDPRRRADIVDSDRREAHLCPPTPTPR